MENNYAMIEMATGFLYNFIIWDRPIEDWDTGSGYYLELANETASYITGSNSQYSSGTFLVSIAPGVIQGFDYTNELSLTGSFTGSFTGSLEGTASYTLTASYLDILKAGTVRFNEWGLDGTINNYYTSSVTFSSSYSNNSYAISLTCGADVRTLSITNKTVSGFEINSNSSTTMTDNVYWIAVPYNNP